MRKALLTLTLLNVIFLSYGITINQQNPPEIFVSDESLTEFKELKNEFGEEDLVFVSNISPEKVTGITNNILMMNGEFSSLSELIPKSGIIQNPQMNDLQKYDFFTKLEEKFPDLKFAGESYTNAHLAGMSLKIQKQIFPLVFGLIFLGIVFLTNNLITSFYLLFSSLLGVGIGLSVTKALYFHSTILTTITPLISFVLTLGVQLHVVHGLAYYKSLSEFFKKKSSPIFIMMVTTLVGFLSLITSDLEAIRQLAVTSSLSLLITWCLLLIIINLFPLRFNTNLPHFIKSKIKMKALPYKPFWGHGILTLFLIGGVVGINKMPLLVEAAEFFSKDHQVQKGLTKISHDLGGTPQLELIITKKDKTEFDISDFEKIDNFENKLSDRFPNTKFITLNNLVKFINEKYSGEKKLPDNIYAFNSLSSQIPPLLLNFQATEKTYRITYMGPIYTTEERDLLENKIKESFSQLDPTFKIKISGLTHLLLRSQKKLVSSLLKSFFLSFFMIVIIFGFFSRNIKEIFFFSFLNFSSIMGGIMVMWLFGMTLNVSSIMTVSISMGLVVDSTVHLLYAEKTNESVDSVFYSTIIPIILAHILLFFSFIFLCFESFIPIRDFSLGLIVLIFVGLFCDLYVLRLIIKK